MDRREFMKNAFTLATLSLFFPFGVYAKDAAEEAKNYENSNHEFIKNFLSKPFNGFGYVRVGNKNIKVDRNLGLIALSNMAEGLVKLALSQREKKEEVITLLDKIVNIAEMVSPWGCSLEKVDNLEDYGVYLSHLNIVLGMRQLLAKDNKYFKLNKKISEYLAERSLSDPQKHMKSYPNKTQKWPADQTATLYSLYLFDKNYNTNISGKPVAEWLNYMKTNATDKKTGLHYSEITGSKYGKYPRGCALSWSIYYISFFAPEEAQKLWEKYKRHYKKSYILFAGFREWPPGVSGPEDFDSGPIVKGIGTAATAFGIRAAKAVGDSITYTQLKNTERLVNLYATVSNDARIKAVLKNLVAISIAFNSERYVKL
jgi:hypothetical protein